MAAHTHGAAGATERRVLITGGAGFIGANLALELGPAGRSGSWSRSTT